MDTVCIPNVHVRECYEAILLIACVCLPPCLRHVLLRLLTSVLSSVRTTTIGPSLVDLQTGNQQRKVHLWWHA